MSDLAYLQDPADQVDQVDQADQANPSDQVDQMMDDEIPPEVLALMLEEQNKGPLTLDSEVDFQDALHVLTQYEFHKTIYCDQEMIGRAVPELKIQRGVVFIQVTMGYIAPYKKGQYTVCDHQVIIPFFAKKMRVRDLAVQPLLDMNDIEKFVIRGQKFSELTKDVKYVHAKGHMYVPVWGGFKRLPIDSRAVVDLSGYNKYATADRWHGSEKLNDVPDEMLMMTLPTVPVYSLEYRSWGEVPVDEVSDIVFDEGAIDRAVLPEEYRTMIKALVTNFYGTECTDFIAGKKKGLVFLLNGKPGTGKTLTAQAIGELTHKPLYIVGSGDLGTDPASIDTKLQQIFNMVQNWSGIVLIDEADVFMSTRTDYDVAYNACVSVFLRLIESYVGILFLTTNRDHNIDSAFDSRIHMRLKYHMLNDDERVAVWAESVRRYKMVNVDVNAFKGYAMNNREIANIVQIANIMVNGLSDKVTTEMIFMLIKQRMAFNLEPVPEEKKAKIVEDMQEQDAKSQGQGTTWKWPWIDKEKSSTATTSASASGSVAE